jgi:hypothetical protein
MEVTKGMQKENKNHQENPTKNNNGNHYGQNKEHDNNGNHYGVDRKPAKSHALLK